MLHIAALESLSLTFMPSEVIGVTALAAEAGAVFSDARLYPTEPITQQAQCRSCYSFELQQLLLSAVCRLLNLRENPGVLSQ